MSETTNMAEMPIKKYTLRKLEAPDVFIMVTIISKLGFREFKECLQSPEIKSLIKQMTGEGKSADMVAASAGVSIAFDIAGIIFANMYKCENDIYKFLSNLSGMTVAEVKKMDMNDFLEMIIDVIKKEEFTDFIGVVSKLLK